MSRPLALKRVLAEPSVAYFKPAGISLRLINEVSLGVEEFEALRLVDFLCLAQEKAASKMGVSQPTLSRVLSSARKKVAGAISNGKALRVEGGSYELAKRRG